MGRFGNLQLIQQGIPGHVETKPQLQKQSA